MTKLQVKHHSSGFTLIELMVVVAIIAILSTIGIGGFASAQKKARDARRRADVKTIQSTMVSASDINGIPDALSTMKEIGGKYPEDPSMYPYLVYAPLIDDGTNTNFTKILESNKFTKDKTKTSVVFIKNSTSNVGLVCATLETPNTGNVADIDDLMTDDAPSGSKKLAFDAKIPSTTPSTTYSETIKKFLGMAAEPESSEDSMVFAPCSNGPTGKPKENCNLFCATF